MAPEVCFTNHYNYKIDVYSFGIMMYEIISDSFPFQKLDKNVIKIKHRQYAKTHPLFGFPIKKSIHNLIESCWDEVPDKRPTFDDIYQMLAFRNANNEEEDCFLEDVDDDQILSFIDFINQQ